MVTKIAVAELKLGMFVVSYGEGTFDSPLAFPQKVIYRREELESIRASGATHAHIDTDKSEQVGPEAAVAPDEPLVPLQDEVQVASRIYGRVLELAHKAWSAARAGKAFEPDEARPVITSLNDSLTRNISGAVSLALLRTADDYSATHAADVALLAMILARQLGMSPERVEQVGLAGLYHDIGLATVSDAILRKPGGLSAEERAVVRSHSADGARILERNGLAEEDILLGVLDHHERWSGGGYPRNIAEGKISRFGRILALADVYDALVSDRPYRQGKSPSEAFRTLYLTRIKDFEPGLTEIFIKAVGVYPAGSFVRLTDGRHAIVCETNAAKPLHPRVKVVFDARMRPRRAEYLDLSVRAEDGRKVEIAACLNPRDYNLDVLRLLA